MSAQPGPLLLSTDGTHIPVESTESETHSIGCVGRYSEFLLSLSCLLQEDICPWDKLVDIRALL